MKISWFPGHMHKARVQIKETIPRVDLVIEVLDARIPFSSENPMLKELRGKKPCLKILNKADLADPVLTDAWIAYLERTKGVKARATTTEDRNSIRQLAELCTRMVPEKAEGKSIITMIAGIPNVGKSTIINILANKKVAKTGNEPAVTKGQQRVNIGNGVSLLDTPGVLWPNVENINSGLRLATIGSIKETAMDYADVGFFIAGFMLENYSDRLMERYKLDELPADRTAFIEAIGQKRGCMRRGGIVDIDRASKIFVTEIRGGKLGPLTFETPQMMETELVETAKMLEKQAAEKDVKKKKRKAAFKARNKKEW